MVLVTGLDLSQTSTGIARSLGRPRQPREPRHYTATVGSAGRSRRRHQQHRRLVTATGSAGTSGNPDLLLIEGPVHPLARQRGVVDIIARPAMAGTAQRAHRPGRRAWWRCRRQLKLWAAASAPPRGSGPDPWSASTSCAPVRLAVRRVLELARRRPRHRGRRGPTLGLPARLRLPLRPTGRRPAPRPRGGASRSPRAWRPPATHPPRTTSTARHQQ